MFQNQITFQAGLVKKGELSTTATGKSYLQITVAKNYSVKNQNNEWENLDPFFINLTLWEKTAELFEASDIPAGTPLLITGTLVGRKRPAYTSQNGTEYPERAEENVIVEAIAVPLTARRIVSVSFLGGGEGKPKAKAPTNKAQSAPKAKEAPKQTEDLFSDDDDFTTDIGDDFDDDDLPF